MPLFLIAYVIACLIVGVYGKDRDFGFYGFFIASIVFTPVLVFFALLLTRDTKKDTKS
jgi:hypothetical protein